MPITPVRPVGHSFNKAKTIAEQAHQKWVQHFNANIPNLTIWKNSDDFIEPYRPVGQIGQGQTPDFIDEIDRNLLMDAYRSGYKKKYAAIKKEMRQNGI